MAVFHGTIRSNTLAMDTQLGVILPYDRPAEAQQTPCKVLYLLHGLGDSASCWTRYTCVETYARDHGIAVIMPEVQRSFYYDMAYGLPYFTYITQELPEICQTMFHLSQSSDDRYIAGLSMGGYGALKCAFTYPEKYRGCASFSGVVDISYVLREHLDDQNQAQSISVFGPELDIKPSDDLKALSRNISSLPRQRQPKLFLTCGTEDFLYDINADFKEHLESLPLDFTYREWPGVHEWGFWDKSVEQALDFFLTDQ